MYSTVSEQKCLDQGKQSKIKYTNPDKAIEFLRDQVYEDIPLEELPIPIANTFHSYTYVVVQKNDLTYHIRFGRVNDFMELGVKHSILAGQDHIVVSGELAVKKYEDGHIEYVVNINSSKMMKHKEFSKAMYSYNLDKGNFIIEPDRNDACQFYYIFMVQLALGIMKCISPQLNIRIPRGMIIKYNQPLYNNLSEKDELLVSYYTEKENTPCPSPEFIEAYNTYGRSKETPHGMCIDKMKEDGYHLIENNGGAEQCRKMGIRRKSNNRKRKNKRKSRNSKNEK